VDLILTLCVSMINIVTDMTNALHFTVCIYKYILNLMFISFICCMTVSISVDLRKVK
jgi:hypothetical protein